MTVQPVNHPDLPPTSGPFAHATLAQGQRTLYISGQVALDERGNVVGVGDPYEQAKQCLRNIHTILQAAGGTPERVAQISVFLTNIDHRAAVAEARKEFFGEHRPASTLLAVTSLVTPDLLVEIEAVAILDQ